MCREVKNRWSVYIINFNSCYRNLASKFNRIISYYKLRLARLPDSNYAISSGFACGAMVSFTPLLGLHFVLAVVFAYLIRGNFIAALIGTVVGNPITFPFIAAICVRTGSFILDRFSIIENELSISDAWEFNSEFTSLSVFEKFLVEVYFEKFIPYSIGGIICGIIAALIVYILSKPLISSYQKRKKKRKKINAKL